MKTNGMKALLILFSASNSVVCAQCGRDLKPENKQRLVRKGCPACGSKRMTFDLPEEHAARLAAVIPQ